MPASEIREVLRYVPQFSGATFLVSVEDSGINESCLAELILDLAVAQQLGVKLILVVSGSEAPSQKELLLERLEENEVRFHYESVDQLPSETSTATVKACLSRKQAFVTSATHPHLSESFINNIIAEHSLDKLIFVTSSNGISRNGAPIPAVNIEEAQQLVKENEVSGAEWMEKAIHYCQQGVPRVHVLDGNTPGVLVSELFSNQGIGTMVYRDDYRIIRPITEEDISEVLAIIGRSVRSSHLIPRDFESIASRINDYYVMTIDQNVMGSIALHVYEEANVAEIACLFVRPEQSGRSYGRELVEFAIEKAKELGVTSVFALTKSAGSFFQHELGFVQQELSIVPKERLQILLESARPSLVFNKPL